MMTHRTSWSWVVGIAFVLGAAGCSNEDAAFETPGNAGGMGGNDSGAIGSGGSIITANDSGSQSDMPADACGLSPFGKTTKSVDILLVIDKSDSMKLKPPGFAVSKWQAMQSALSAALDQVKGGLSFGLELFPFGTLPDGGSDSCAMPPDAATAVQIPVGPGTTTVPDIISRLSTAPAGSTPTAVALARAQEYFVTGAGKDLPGDKYVLLATDGGPNCNEAAPACAVDLCTTNIDGLCTVTGINCCDGVVTGCLDTASTVGALGALLTAGIKTIIVGIPGSELYQTELDQFAVAGGMQASGTSPKYYKVDAEADAGDGVDRLTSTFEQIAQKLITTCRLQLTSDPPALDLLNVTVDDTVIPAFVVGDGGSLDASGDANGDAGSSGWTLDTTTKPPTVVLEGAICRKVESQGVSSVQVLYGCPTVSVY